MIKIWLIYWGHTYFCFILKFPLLLNGKIDKFWYFHIINEESESGFKVQRY